MSKLRLLWVDLTRSVREAEPPRAFERYCELRPLHDLAALERSLEAEPPDGVLFDFDYPDRSGLQLMQQTKASVPGIPMLMMTLQHSEALAVWAFRSRLWDYLVKPVSYAEAARCTASLQEALARKTGQAPRKLASPRQHERVPESSSAAPSRMSQRLMPAINYVEKNFRDKIYIEDLARLCSMSSFHFSRCFKEAFGIGLREYLLRYRLREACRLLENPRASVTDVCYAVGFNDHSYFTRMFRRHFGMPPSAALGAQAAEQARALRLPPLSPVEPAGA